MAGVVLLSPRAFAQVRVGIELGSTRLGSSDLDRFTHPLFDDSTAEYVGIDVMHALRPHFSLGGVATVSASERGSDARIVTAQAEVSWTFRPERRLQPHVDVSLGYSLTHNRHFGIQTLGEGIAGGVEAGLRVGFGSGRTGFDIGWSGLDVASRGLIAPNSTVFLGISMDFGRRHPRWRGGFR